MAYNKKYTCSVKQRIQMVWFYAEIRSSSLTPTKFVKHFDLDSKHGKLSKQTILAVVKTSFWKLGLCWMYLTVVDRKLRDQQLTLMQLDQQYWKSKEVYPWTFGKTQTWQSEETNNSAS